jgi:hypothetical protein
MDLCNGHRLNPSNSVDALRRAQKHPQTRVWPALILTAYSASSFVGHFMKDLMSRCGKARIRSSGLRPATSFLFLVRHQTPLGLTRRHMTTGLILLIDEKLKAKMSRGKSRELGQESKGVDVAYEIRQIKELLPVSSFLRSSVDFF